MREVYLTLRRFVKVHLFNLLNGRPHKVPLCQIIPHHRRHYGDPFVNSKEINGSRIALLVEFADVAGNYEELIAWDWRTGEVVSCSFLLRGNGFISTLTQVLERSRDDPGIGDAISGIYHLHLLEGPWLLALSRRDADYQLLVFNTSLPQQDPRSWRILELPQPADGPYWFASPYDPSAERPEFLIDPAQRIFVIPSLEFATVIPVEPFLRMMSSVCSSTYLQWDDWGRYAIKAHLPLPRLPALQLVDTKILSLHSFLLHQTKFFVDMCDLSKSSRRCIQPATKRVEEGYGGVPLNPKWTAQCQMEIRPNTVRFMGNKLVCIYVSPPRIQNCSPHAQSRSGQRRSLTSGEDYYLRIWKIG